VPLVLAVAGAGGDGLPASKRRAVMEDLCCRKNCRRRLADCSIRENKKEIDWIF